MYIRNIEYRLKLQNWRNSSWNNLMRLPSKVKHLILKKNRLKFFIRKMENSSASSSNFTTHNELCFNSTLLFANETTIADKDPTGFDCGNYDLILNALVKFILLGFGCVGNSLSVVVMWSERHVSATALLLIILAVVDTLLMFAWLFLITAPGKQSSSDKLVAHRVTYCFKVCFFVKHFGNLRRTIREG